MYPTLKRGGTGWAGSAAQSGPHAATAAAARRRRGFFMGRGNRTAAIGPRRAVIIWRCRTVHAIVGANSDLRGPTRGLRRHKRRKTMTEHSPFVPDGSRIAEFTLRAVVMGVLLGMLFGASSLYLVLKVGLTVSASIPVAVIAITLFRLASKAGGRDSTILENNIVQTAGSAGESIAFGLGVTMPAILILGFDLEIARVMLVAVLGALLGILMMIPLRRTLIVARHGELKYPEGTACAEVLKAAELSKSARGGGEARADPGRAGVIFLGFGIGLAYKTVNIALKGWKDVPEKDFGAPLKGGSVGVEISPELLGVGYIIGPRIASIMCAGGVLAYLLLIPLIKFFGDALPVPLAPGAKLIHDMSPNQIRGAYVLYIGAGAV